VHRFSRVMALAAGLALSLGLLLLSLGRARAGTAGAGVYRVVSIHNTAVFINGIPASPGATYSDGDVVSIDAAADGSTVLSRSASGMTTSWTHYGSVHGVTFQAIWIGD